MKVSEIYDYLNEISPFSTQELWDNSGLIIGDKNKIIKEIFVCLEVSLEIIQNAKEDSLIIAHHPLIFQPLKQILFDQYPSNLIAKLIQKNISLIAMHTNFDISHLNIAFAKEILGFDSATQEGFAQERFVCKVAFNDSFQKLTCIIKSKLEKSHLKITQTKDFINDIAIICGAGLGAIENPQAFDCIITGDIKYHDAMKFKSLNISLIDVGHYESERHFGRVMADCLKNINYNAIILDSQNPFH